MFIAKNNDLIILAKETREELEQALQLMVYTSIEETDIQYTLYNGQYLTPKELEVEQSKRRNLEIDAKIKELRNMSLIDIMNNNKENIQIYNDVIFGLEMSRPSI